MTVVVRKLMAAALAAALVVAWGLMGAASAHGAEYRVSACGSNAANQNHLLTASVSDGHFSAYTACPNDGNSHYVGVAALANVNAGTAPFFSSALQSFVAPGGTTIRRVHVKAEGRAWNGDWTSLLQASTDRFASNVWNLSGCGGNPGSVNGCVSALVNLDQNYEIPGATGIRSVAGCANFGGCTTFSTGTWPYSRSYYFIHELDVTLDDYSAPAVSATGGGLASGHWLNGTESLTFNASDNSGIRRTRFWVDDLGVISDDDRGCDYTYSVPCSNVSGREYSVDTTRLSDGVHHIAADGFDATDSNWSNTYQEIYVDNHAPTEPVSPSVVGGEGWHTTNDFNVRWDNPPSAAPIDRAYYELCKVGGSCLTGYQSGTGIAQLTNLQMAQPGDYTIRVWLSDEAGNLSDARTPVLHLKFDNVAPAQAAPQHRNGWVDRSHAHEFDQEIDPHGDPPVSGLAGYAVTRDGSTPGAEIDVPAAASEGFVGHTHFVDLPEGTTTVRARAISGAGIPSSEVGSTDIHVDRTPPVLNLQGAPDPNEWTQGPVTLRLNATDPGTLSGMAGGPEDRPVTSGGFIGYSIDGSPREQVRGPERALAPDGRLEHAPAAEAVIPVIADGAHLMTYQASDVAGNPTPERSINLKIDHTPPELAVFEAQQQADPRLITVAASDRTSGLADGGRIELRRVAPSRGDWISLRTAREGDRYYAHVDNASLPEGDYQFRAFVPDQAGNQAVGTTGRAGREEVLHISPTQVGPYLTIDDRSHAPRADGGAGAQDANATVDTKLTAAAVRTMRATKKCLRPKNRKKPKRCKRTKASKQFVHEMTVAFGKRAAVRGTLRTSAGVPLAGVEVTVLSRLAMAGADYAAEASVRTKPDGSFSYTAPARAGRTLDFHYRGDSTYKHADDQVTLRVPAAATIRASKHAVRNGGRVTFTGRLRGGPYPAKGKVFDLQAFYRHKWRTFATPRARLNGGWKYRYRFQATRGTVLYKFRVRVRASSDYPYELGYSKVTKVRVVGP